MICSKCKEEKEPFLYLDTAYEDKNKGTDGGIIRKDYIYCEDCSILVVKFLENIKNR